jgi:hypothetical protein
MADFDWADDISDSSNESEPLKKVASPPSNSIQKPKIQKESNKSNNSKEAKEFTREWDSGKEGTNWNKTINSSNEFNTNQKNNTPRRSNQDNRNSNSNYKGKNRDFNSRNNTPRNHDFSPKKDIRDTRDNRDYRNSKDTRDNRQVYFNYNSINTPPANTHKEMLKKDKKLVISYNTSTSDRKILTESQESLKSSEASPLNNMKSRSSSSSYVEKIEKIEIRKSINGRKSIRKSINVDKEMAIITKELKEIEFKKDIHIKNPIQTKTLKIKLNNSKELNLNQLKKDHLNQSDIEEIEKLMIEKYMSKEWVYGKSPKTIIDTSIASWSISNGIFELISANVYTDELALLSETLFELNSIKTKMSTLGFSVDIQQKVLKVLFSD